jgi:hypothetical protein
MEGAGVIPELVGLGIKTRKFRGIGVGWGAHPGEYSGTCVPGAF